MTMDEMDPVMPAREVFQELSGGEATESLGARCYRCRLWTLLSVCVFTNIALVVVLLFVFYILGAYADHYGTSSTTTTTTTTSTTFTTITTTTTCPPRELWDGSQRAFNVATLNCFYFQVWNSGGITVFLKTTLTTTSSTPKWFDHWRPVFERP